MDVILGGNWPPPWLTPNAGFLLGGETPGIADIITATLWTTMTDHLPKIGTILQATAPLTATLAARVSALPPLAKLAAKSMKTYGDVYCGGQIEISIRKVLDT